jgi:hypothetical protein
VTVLPSGRQTVRVSAKVETVCIVTGCIYK